MQSCRWYKCRAWALNTTPTTLHRSFQLQVFCIVSLHLLCAQSIPQCWCVFQSSAQDLEGLGLSREKQAPMSVSLSVITELVTGTRGSEDDWCWLHTWRMPHRLSETKSESCASSLSLMLFESQVAVCSYQSAWSYFWSCFRKLLGSHRISSSVSVR